MKMDAGDKQASLNAKVATTIKESGLTLSELQARTGIHRAKLGRMRLEQCSVSCDEAQSVFEASHRPARALLATALLCSTTGFSDEALAYLDQFLATLSPLLEHLSALGASLNPRWAAGTTFHLRRMIEEQVERINKIDSFSDHADNLYTPQQGTISGSGSSWRLSAKD